LKGRVGSYRLKVTGFWFQVTGWKPNPEEADTEFPKFPEKKTEHFQYDFAYSEVTSK
jgi:hypothetical protein